MTKNGVSYIASHFWKVVGGPFDVRDITVNDAVVNDLSVSVTTENTGGATKDLTLTWNLTRTDTGAVLHSGADTFAVTGNSVRVWTVYPSTSYVGEVKITFLGFYSGTEKAGAFEVFSTAAAGATPPPTGGGGSSSGGGSSGGSGLVISGTPGLKITKFEKEVNVANNIRKTVSLEIENTGSVAISHYAITPESISLLSGEKKTFKIDFLVTGLFGIKSFKYAVSSGSVKDTKDGILVVLDINDFLVKELSLLKQRFESLKTGMRDDIRSDFDACENIINLIEVNIAGQKFIDARDGILEAERCLSGIEAKIAQPPPAKKEEQKDTGPAIYIDPILLLVVVAVSLLVLMAGIFLYIMYKKMGVISFLKKEGKPEGQKEYYMKDKYLDERIDRIRERMGMQKDQAPQKAPETRADTEQPEDSKKQEKDNKDKDAKEDKA